MERKVQLYIEGDRVELFKDEQISINSSVQNIADLSKVYTDFTQTFSIPASPSNNVIMRHFYNSEVILYDNEFTNPQLRRDASIEIDGTFFKRGKVQLENAKLENGEPYSYSITFYGVLVSLKDTFKELKLADLDWDSLAHNYSYDEIKDRIEDGATNYDVRYPLITSTRYWQYNNSQTPDENIDTTQGAINWTELFPAVKLSAIFNVLQSNFNVTFQGNFLTDKRFTDAFMLFKNKQEFSFITPPQIFTFTELYDDFQSPPIATAPFNYSHVPPANEGNGLVVFDSSNNTFRMTYRTFPTINGISDNGVHSLRMSIANVYPSNIQYYIDVYRGNQIFTTITINNGGVSWGGDIYVEDNANTPNLDSTIRVEVRSDLPLTFGYCYIRYNFRYFAEGQGYFDTDTFWINGQANLITEGQQNLSTSAPDIKVTDLFSNILKLYNLTCYGVEENVYQIEQLETWYDIGDIVDVTEYTDFSTMDIKRIELFKNIDFKYEESKSLTNRFFNSQFMREYGNLSNVFNYESGDYAIEVFSENLLFSKFTNTDLQVGYCLDENLNGYVPKSVLSYKYDNLPCSFYLTDGQANTDEITSYVPFGAEVIENGTSYSLNFGSEQSTYTNTPNINGMYNTYYRGYLENLYDPKNREIKVKSILPISIVTTLDLNDRLIIRDKRYIINNLKINLITGECDLVLINDFRKMIADGVPPIYPPIKPDSSAQCLDVRIPFIKNAVSCTIVECTSPSVSGVTITPSTITSEGIVEVCIPDNPNATTFIVTEDMQENIITEIEGEEIVTELSDDERSIILCITYTLSNGDLISNQIFIEQG